MGRVPQTEIFQMESLIVTGGTPWVTIPHFRAIISASLWPFGVFPKNTRGPRRVPSCRRCCPRKGHERRRKAGNGGESQTRRENSPCPFCIAGVPTPAEERWFRNDPIKQPESGFSGLRSTLPHRGGASCRTNAFTPYENSRVGAVRWWWQRRQESGPPASHPPVQSPPDGPGPKLTQQR